MGTRPPDGEAPAPRRPDGRISGGAHILRPRSARVSARRRGLSLEAQALLRELAAGRIPRLLLAHGPEPLLVDELVARVGEAVLADPAEAAWNREVLHADTAAPDAVVTAGLALPLFGQRRLVLVRGLAEAGARAVERLRAAIEAARARAGGWPSEGVTVVLMAPGVDRKSPVLRLVPDADQVELRPPTGRAVVGWLSGRARAAGLTLTPSAGDALLALVGEDLGRLAGELEKAAVYVGADGRVTDEVVLALAGESRVRQYWELKQALEDGKAAEALRVLEQLLAAGEEPTPLLGQVTAFVRDAWRVKAAVAEGKSPRQIAPLLKPRRPEWAVERLAARATAIRGEALEAALHRCFEVERRLKSGEGEPRGLLTALVADVAAA